MSLSIEHIAKVEGHGKLHVNVNKGEIECVQMEIFEGARYFEGLVKDRPYNEVPAVVSRICGICSQSHLLCSQLAIENALKVRVTKQTKQLRELLMLASLMQSHVLHLYFLALPDYLGYDSALAMAGKYKKEVARALQLKRLANDIVKTIGGREIHSLTPVIGGFSQLPTQKDIDHLLKRLKEHKADIEKTAQLFGKLKYPAFTRKTQYLALRDKDKIDYLKGNLYTNKTKFTPQKYSKYITENVVDYSNTKCVKLKDSELMVGALARINNNKKYFSRNAKSIINKSKIKFPSNNPYHNNAAQGFEIVDFYERMISILKNLKIKDEEPKQVKSRAGHGFSVVEAPRGTLIHEYEINAKGRIKKANIIAPTTINLANIEEDIKAMLPELMKKTKSKNKIRDEMEKLIRAYDPCISCSTHFLELVWNEK
ncbi:MAG: Ni/Fe hydrogenase subunit alpha [Candidatus Nanoarchaeia archaeon]